MRFFVWIIFTLAIGYFLNAYQRPSTTLARNFCYVWTAIVALFILIMFTCVYDLQNAYEQIQETERVMVEEVNEVLETIEFYKRRTDILHDFMMQETLK